MLGENATRKPKQQQQQQKTTTATKKPPNKQTTNQTKNETENPNTLLLSEKTMAKDVACMYCCKNTALAAWHPLPKFERSQYEHGKKEIFYQQFAAGETHSLGSVTFCEH